MVKKKIKFDIKILLKKFAKNLVVVILAGIASVYGNNPTYLAIAPLILALENYWKHK